MCAATLTPTPVASDDALNAAIAGALVGASPTAAVTLLIFIFDRIFRSRRAFRETRREVMAEYFDAMASFVIAATAPRSPPEGCAPQAAALIAARSKLILAPGDQLRTRQSPAIAADTGALDLTALTWRDIFDQIAE